MKKTQQNAKSDNNKQQKIKKQNRKTKKTNKRKQRTFMSAYFSLGASVESRITIIQSQEPKSAGEKMTRKKSGRKSPLVFPVYAF